MIKRFLPLMLAIAILFTACSSSGDKDKDGADTKVVKHAMGDSAKGENYTLTLKGAETSDEVPIGDTLSNFPADGKVYLLIGLEVKNNTKESQEPKMWDCAFMVDNHERDNVNLAPEVEIQGEKYHRMGDNTVIEPGKSMLLYVATEIPEDWKSCELTYDGVTFVISAEEATPPEAPEAPVYQIGEAAKTDNYNVTLTIGESMKKVEDTSVFYFEASEGKTFLILVFDVENTTDEKLQLWARGNFDLTVDDEEIQLTKLGPTGSTVKLNGKTYGSFVGAGLYGNYELEAKGHEVRYIAAEVPENWSHFAITFDGVVFEGNAAKDGN